MSYFLLAHTLSLLLHFFAIARHSDRHKDLQFLLLRQQLRILQRRQPHAPRISRWEKLTLPVLAAKFTPLGHSAHAKLSEVTILFKPDTLLKWHRELVRPSGNCPVENPLHPLPLLHRVGE